MEAVGLGSRTLNARGRFKALVFYFSANGSTNSDVFLAKIILHPKGNRPSKFQLVGVCRFGGVRVQTDSLTFYCFYRVIK